MTTLGKQLAPGSVSRKGALLENGKRSGFTLIELLVVIAIIAILAAILFPVFARARENARRTSCMSNQKQIGLGVLQYRQDYDECFPLVFWTAATSWVPSNAYIPTATFPYTKSAQLWRCPSQPDTIGQIFSPDTSRPKPVAGDPRTTYTFNFYITARNVNATTTPPTAQSVSEASVPEQSTVVMMAEMNFLNNMIMGDSFAHVWNDTPPPGSIRQGFPHLEGANYLFIDGHVKFLPKAKGGIRGEENCLRWGRTWSTSLNACSMLNYS